MALRSVPQLKQLSSNCSEKAVNKLLSKRTIQYVTLALVLGLALYNGVQDTSIGTWADSEQSLTNNAQVNSAYESRQSDVQVNGVGQVVKVLPDDNKGSRHQKMILKTSSGLRLLIAHNIDLAPRIGNIREGDSVEFYGEYEWNEKGGVIHWTHHDPVGRHIHGWLKHQGEIYQ
ncbi:MAG: hypothetical protein ACJAUG_001629 [Halioglobus sp.]